MGYAGLLALDQADVKKILLRHNRDPLIIAQMDWLMDLTPGGNFNNAAKDYQRIVAKPLAAAMGAEICGIDLAADLDDQSFAEIQDALFRHKMIFFRNQTLGHAGHESFSLRFGEFAEDAYTDGIPEHPAVQPLIKEAEDKVNWVFGNGWHSDSPFMRSPPVITILRSIEVPPFGGDTFFANTALAYRMLSDAMKAMINPLRVHMSMGQVLAAVQKYEKASDSIVGRLAATRDLAEIPEDLKSKIDGQLHPLVRRHPVTGEQSLYCDPYYSVGIEGMSEPESRAILKFLTDHMTQIAFTCRLRWEPNMVTLWDNRICIHHAFNDYEGHRREMYRTTVAGEIPQA